MAYLVLQHRRWWARFQVPADVRATIGKSEHWVNLGTEDRKLAETRAPKAASAFRAMVLEARGRLGTVEADAVWWRDQLKDDSLGVARDALARHVADRFVKGGHRRLLRVDALAPFDGNELAAAADLGGPRAAAFIGIATGKASPLAPFIEPHIERRRSQVEAKTADMASSDLKQLVAKLPTLDRLTREGVTAWVQDQVDAGLKPDAIKRKLSGFRAFWAFLQDRGEVAKDAPSPFDKVKVAGGRAKGRNGSYLSFSPAEVSSLHNAARAKGDHQLADLIALAAYSGARIEELCALQLTAARGAVFRITDAKTEAGNREVPIHPKLAGLVTRLSKASADGYLLSGLAADRYGNRSSAIGKRFGYLKRAHGFDERRVFHSIRKCAVTQMERGGFLENVTADIVGHERPRITYGLYSGGSSLAQRKAAVACLSYPGALGRP